MDRRTFIGAIPSGLLTLALTAQAQHLIINLKTAKALGLTIPQSLLRRAVIQ